MQKERKRTIDFRSDTVTKPGTAMMEAMMKSEVGDDVYGEDPTVNKLEAKAAAIFGMGAGLFCPSGTMTNQISIKILTRPGDEVICDRTAHIYNYEGGGIAFNSLASVRLIEGERGRMVPAQIEENINDIENVHFARTSLVALENTVNKGGGSYYTLEQIKAISAVCKKNGLALHMDGARVFNALTETGENPAEYGKYFDTISVCFSKGLGAPVGSVLLASRDLIMEARRVRKVLGGGMRQAGFLAAAAVYALDHNVERLKQDHEHAAILAECLQALPYVAEVLPQETNIVIFRLKDTVRVADFTTYTAAQGMLVSPFGKQMIRLVTHLNISRNMIEDACHILRKYIVE